MVMGRYQIGSLPVEIHCAGGLPPALAGLGRLAPASARGAKVRLEVQTVPARDWDLGPSRQDGTYGVGRPAHFLTVEVAPRTVSVRVVPAPVGNAALYWLQRDLFAAFGSLSGEPLLHASAVIHRGSALVFCGHTGVGKSTIAHLLSGHAEVVNDETNWLTWAPDGSPVLVDQRYWLGTATAPTAPLQRVVVLEQGTYCQLGAELAPAEALASLLAVHLPFDASDPALCQRACSLVRLLQQTKVRRLRFCLDPQQLELVLYGDDAT
jgi:hypothetical protein